MLFKTYLKMAKEAYMESPEYEANYINDSLPIRSEPDSLSIQILLFLGREFGIEKSNTEKLRYS